MRHARPRCLPLHLRGTLRYTGATSSSEGSCDAYTGAVAAAASSGSLSSRAAAVIHWDSRHIHPMVTQRKASQAATLTAIEGEPRVSPIPFSVRDALADPHWHRATDEEYAALLANQTWDLVPRPSGCNVVTGKWIWTHKRQADGTLKRYKARWVLRGFIQRPGVFYDETFSLVGSPLRCVRSSRLRSLTLGQCTSWM